MRMEIIVGAVIGIAAALCTSIWVLLYVTENLWRPKVTHYHYHAHDQRAIYFAAPGPALPDGGRHDITTI